MGMFVDTAATSRATIPNVYDTVLSKFPPKKQENVRELLDVLSTVQNFSIDPRTLQISIDGTPTPGSDITDILQILNSPPGIKETAKIIAHDTNYPASHIKSAPVRDYINYGQEETTPKVALASKTSKRARESESGQPRVKWEDVEGLPTGTTCTGRLYK